MTIKFKGGFIINKKRNALLFATLLSSAVIATGCSDDETNIIEADDKKITESSTKVEEKTETSPTPDEKTELSILTEPKNEKVETAVSPNKAIDTNVSKPTIMKETTTDGKTKTLDKESKSTAPASVISFSSKIDNYYKVDFNNGWKLSPDKLYQITIDGRGENAFEEGIGSLVIKNNKTNNLTIYTLKNNEETQLTPKVTEWIDENRLYIIIGFSYGTVSKGGNLYEFNLENNTLKPIIKIDKDTDEIISIKKNDNGTFTYVKHMYDADFNIGTTKEYTIKP